MISKRTVLPIMNSAFFVVTLPSQQGKQDQKSTDSKGTKQRMTIGDITECHWGVLTAFFDDVSSAAYLGGETGISLI